MACVPVKYPDSQTSTPKHSTTNEGVARTSLLSQAVPAATLHPGFSSNPVPASARRYTPPAPSLYPLNPEVQKDRDSKRGTSVAPVPAFPSLSWPENSTSRIPGHSLPPPAPAIQQSAVLLPTGCPAQRHTPPPPLTPKQTPASSIHENWVGVHDSESPGTRGLRVPPRPPSHAASLQPCLGGASTRGEEETWGSPQAPSTPQGREGGSGPRGRLPVSPGPQPLAGARPRGPPPGRRGALTMVTLALRRSRFSSCSALHFSL